MQVIAEPESAYDAPLFPTHSSHLCCHEQTGWGRQNEFAPRRGEPLVRHCRLEALLRGPIQWRVQKFLRRVIKS